MKRLLKQTACACLAAALLLLSACGTGTAPAEADGDSTGSTAKGRYMEAQLSLPDQVGYIKLLDQTNNGDLIVIGNYTKDYTLGPYGLWRSTDGGASWTEESAPWQEEFNIATYLAGAALGPDDSYYLIYSQGDVEETTAYLASQGFPGFEDQATPAGDTSTEDVPSSLEESSSTALQILGGDEGETEIYVESTEFEDEEYEPEEYLFAHGDEHGLTLLPYPAPTEPEYGISPSGLTVLENGDFIIEHYFSLMQMNAATGETGHSYEVYNNGQPASGFYTVFDNMLVISIWDGIDLYDMDTGEAVDSVMVVQDSSSNAFSTTDDYDIKPIAYAPEESAIYYASSSGIYRSLIDGATTEQLLDGELTSLNMPSLSLQNLLIRPDGSFLVLATEGDNYLLYHYSYNPDVSAVPSTQLKVYSLQDNATIRQAMGVFQQQNPDVKISYTVGLTGEDGMTTTDAMRSLSNELLAGNGPDVLVLDGMLVDSYIKNGVLLDLSDMLNSDIKNGILLKNVCETYRSGDSLYAVPARFSVPVLNASDDAADSINSLSSLADWVEGQETVILPYNVGVSLLTQFYDLYAPVWFGEDNSLDANAFAASLADISRIKNATKPLYNFNEAESDSTFYHNLLWHSVLWGSKEISLNIAVLNSISDIAGPDAAIKKRGEGQLIVLENGQGGVFIPRTVLGVNAAGNQIDLALEFVQKNLSLEVQEYNFNDGLPVNTNALHANMQSPYTNHDDGGYYSTSFERDDGHYVAAYLEIIWPSDQWMEDMISKITAIETASPTNLVIKEMIMEECKDYFSGSRTLEDTVLDVSQKVDMYLAEQA